MSTRNIAIENAILGYGKNKSILKQVNLYCEAGEMIGLAGLNGSGKSTLLRSVAGHLPPMSGRVLVNEREITTIPVKELATMIAAVFTERISGFNLTCYDAVAAGQMPYTNLFNGLNDQNKKVIEECILKCGLTDHIQKQLHELSDGLFQKTMIAKCLAQQTGILLLDEPVAFLDFASRHELFILLKKLCLHENKTVLVSSHDLDLMLKYCTRIFLVRNGEVISLQTSEAREHPLFKELSGGFL